MIPDTTPALFLDDERDPPSDGRTWVVVRSAEEAIDWMTEHGIPNYVSFDHDLGLPTTGAHVAQWMIDRDLDCPGSLPQGFDYFVHSQNGAGARTIAGKLDGYVAYRSRLEGRPVPLPRRRTTMGA